MKHNKYIEHQYVKMYWATNNFTEFLCCGTHNKPHGVRRLVKNYNTHFYPKLGHGMR